MEALRMLLEEAGCPEGEIESNLRGLRSNGVDCPSALREKLQLQHDLADLGVKGAVSWKRKFKDRALRQEQSEHTYDEVELAFALSQLAYEDAGTTSFQKFQVDYKPLFLEAFKSPATGQRYIIAVVEKQTPDEGAEMLLCVAFAGTHTFQDWFANVDIKISHSSHVGGGVHSGFFTRASQLSVLGWQRLVQTYSCTKVLFAGHSLGGAVAHMVGLIQSHQKTFGDQIKVLTVGFGSPLCITKQFAEAVFREGWASKFLTVVNGQDPVPCIMNLAETIPQLLSDARGLSEDSQQLLHAFLGALCPLRLPLLQGVASGGIQAVAGELRRLQNSPDVRALLDRADVYSPFGMYMFVDHDGGSVGGKRVNVINGLECKGKLGAARLLQQRVSPLESMLDRDAVMMHSLPKYDQVVKAKAVMEVLPSNRNVSFGNKTVTSAGCLQFKIKNAQYRIEDGRTLYCHIIGQDLDFVNPGGVNLASLAATDIKITYVSATCMVFQAETAGVRYAAPVSIEICADVGSKEKITASAEAPATDQKQCGLGDLSEAFLPMMMKAAWLHKQHLKDEVLLNQLRTLDDVVGKHKVAVYNEISNNREPDTRTFAELIEAVTEERCFHKVGQDEDAKEHCKHVYDWLLPSGGHRLRTYQQQVGRFTVAIVAICAIAFVYSTGGLGLVGGLLGVGGSLTGGYGTMGVLGVAGGSSFWFIRSRLAGQYTNLLYDLHSWTGAEAPLSSTGNQFQMEEALIARVEDLKRASRVAFPGPWHGEADESAKKLLGKLYNAVKAIHSMKKLFGAYTCICIAGPQKAGKSLLCSQLMMSAEIAMRESSIVTSTEDSPTYRWTDKVLLVDTPGLTSVQARVREVFSQGAQLVQQACVYLCDFQYKTQDSDVQAIKTILLESSVQSPPLLICLNKISSKLKTGTGYLRREELLCAKEEFLGSLKREIFEDARQEGWVKWLQSSADRYFERKWKNVRIVFSELGDTALLPDMPEELRNMVSHEVYNARRIAEWLGSTLDADGKDPSLQEKVKSISREAWERGFNRR